MVAHMYSEHPETRSYVEPLFLVDNSEVPKIREVDPEYSSGEETDEEDSKPEATTPPRETPADATSSKIPDLSRKTHRFTTCYTCRKEYDVTENNLKACDFHIGQIDYLKLYWGRYCRPEKHITTEENFERRPAGFMGFFKPRHYFTSAFAFIKMVVDTLAQVIDCDKV
ncbi:hypothetical protein BKA81DRAFT_409149 [Phyllosticta paracitricarpa]